MVALAVGLVLVVGWLMLVGAVVATVAVDALVRRRRSSKRSSQLVAALPGLVDDLARSIRSGASFAQAFREASVAAAPAVRSELTNVVELADRGYGFGSAIGTWAQGSTISEVRIVGAALALAVENESGTTLALEGVSNTLRDRSAMTNEIRALTAQASSSLRALIVMPMLFVAIDALTARRVVGYLWSDPLGQMCLGLAIGLELVGWAWMRLLLHRVSP